MDRNPLPAIVLRPPPVWSDAASRYLLSTFAVVAMLLYLSPWVERPDGDIDLVRLVAYAASFAAAVALGTVLRRLWLQRLGIPPIRFDADFAELPAGPASRRLRRIRYADIQTLSMLGEGAGECLAIDTPRHAFLFPAAAFAEPGGLHRLGAGLAERIDARSDAPAIWAAMRRRHEWGQHFLARRTPAARALVYVLIAIYALQWFFLPAGLAMSMLELGANIPERVWQGEWFRLATANLLHANAVHLLSNAWFAWVVGAIVERQFGTGRFLILLLATGAVSMLVSALVMSLLAPAAYSIGASGALFGLLGAQAAFTWRHGAQLPGALRFTAATWAVLLVLNFVVLPLVIPQLDVAAHVGGLLAGLGIGWLWCRYTPDLPAQPTVSHRERAVLGLLAAAWLFALVEAFWVTSPPA